MGNEDDLTVEKIKKQKRLSSVSDIQKIWKSIADNYELINGAQLSNSFIIHMTLKQKNLFKLYLIFQKLYSTIV